SGCVQETIDNRSQLLTGNPWRYRRHHSWLVFPISFPRPGRSTRPHWHSGQQLAHPTFELRRSCSEHPALYAFRLFRSADAPIAVGMAIASCYIILIVELSDFPTVVQSASPNNDTLHPRHQDASDSARNWFFSGLVSRKVKDSTSPALHTASPLRKRNTKVNSRSG